MSEIGKIWHKVEEMELLIFGPEIIWYAKNHDIRLRFYSFHIFEKITKNRRQAVKPKNLRDVVKFHDRIIELA